MFFSGLQTYSKTKHGFEAVSDTVNTESDTRDSKKTGIDPQRLVSSLFFRTANTGLRPDLTGDKANGQKVVYFLTICFLTWPILRVVQQILL